MEVNVPPRIIEKSTEKATTPLLKKSFKPNSILLGKGMRSKRTGSVRFSDKVKEHPLSPYNRKAQLDWELMPSNDDTFDKEHEDFIKRSGQDDEKQAKIQAHKEYILSKMKEQKDEEEAAEKPKEIKKFNPTKYRDHENKKYGNLLKAIEDNQCMKEQWVTLKKEFNDLKGQLSEGITCKKYGKNNIFSSPG